MAQFLLFILLTLPLVRASGSYNLADLEILSQEGSYKEFFAHAMDVRPSERQDAWKAMVSKMADLYTRKILEKPGSTPEEFNKLQQLWQWPSLKDDEVFRIRRREIAIRHIKSCLKEATPCWEDLNRFWESDHSDSETAFKLAEIVSEQKDSPVTLWTYLSSALKSPLSEFYCKKEFAMKSLWGKLEVDYIRLGPKGDLLKKIDETIHPDCLPSLNKEARVRLMSPENTGDRELGYQILHSQGKTDQRVSDFFHTVYLLENPSQGELFNYSWNRLIELGKTSMRRESVMDTLKSLDPLPDEIFTSLDITKKRVVLGHIKRYFPEYIDHYVNQCVNFYGGKKVFPKGNPTMHCQDLMNSELAPNILDQFQIKQYQDVRKI